jgi:hypothetical protein
MPQNDQNKPDIGQYLPELTFWLTVFCFGLGLWLEFKSPGIAIIGASLMSWIGHFCDWVTTITEIRHGVKSE